MARRRGEINLLQSRSIGGGAEKNGGGAKKQKFCRKTKKDDVEKRKNVGRRGETFTLFLLGQQHALDQVEFL